MARLKILGWLALFVSTLLVAGGVMTSQSVPPSPVLVTAGQRYVVVWDCLPTWIADYISQTAAGGRPLPSCYVEELTVQAVRSDGWWLVTDEDGTPWSVNPARMIGLRLAAPALRVQAPTP